MQRMRYVLFNNTRLTMEARTETFLALVKAVTISTERVSSLLKQVHTRRVYLEVETWSVLQLSDLGLGDSVRKTCCMSKQSQRFPSWASAGLKC